MGRGHVVLHLCLAAVIGFTLLFVPVLPCFLEDELVSPSNVTYNGEGRAFSLQSIQDTLKRNEAEHAGESLIGNVSWHYLPLMVIVGLVTGVGAYFVMRSRPGTRL
jgi:hypothetical protein